MTPTTRPRRVVRRGKACVHGLVGACLLVALLAACGGSTEAGPPEVGPLPVIRSAADLRLPLDHYVGSWNDRITLETAREELVSRCMAQRGYPGYPVGDYSAHLLQPRTGNRFGVYDEKQARERGFAPAWREAFEQEAADLTNRFADWSSPDIDAALKGAATAPAEPDAGASGADAGSPAGPPSGGAGWGTEGGESSGLMGEHGSGCIGQSHRELLALGGAAELDRSWITMADESTVVQAEDDARMRGPVAAWKACMDAAGYRYATREDAAADDRWQSHPPEERTVAVASVRCTQSSRLLDTWVALATAYQQRFVEQNAERLAEDRAFKDAALKAIAEQGLGRIGGSEGGPPPSR